MEEKRERGRAKPGLSVSSCFDENQFFILPSLLTSPKDHEMHCFCLASKLQNIFPIILSSGLALLLFLLPLLMEHYQLTPKPGSWFVSAKFFESWGDHYCLNISLATTALSANERKSRKQSGQFGDMHLSSSSLPIKCFTP